MKTAIHFILTATISTGSLLAATKAPNPWPYFGIMDIYIMSFKKLYLFIFVKNQDPTQLKDKKQ